MSSDFPKAVEAFHRGDLGLALDIAIRTTAVGDPQWQHLIGLIHCRQGDLLRGLPHLQLAAGAGTSRGSRSTGTPGANDQAA